MSSIRTSVAACAALLACAAATTTPPDRPLTVVPDEDGVHLSWPDAGATTWTVVQDGQPVATTTTPAHSVPLADDAPHTFEVLANGVPIDPAGTLTAVAADTTVTDDEVRVHVLRRHAAGATLLVEVSDPDADVVAVHVRAEGNLLGRHVVTGGRAIVDVWGLAPAAVDTVELLLEDLAGNLTVAVEGRGHGLAAVLSIEHLRDLPLPPVRVRAEFCRDGTSVTWSTLGTHSGRWLVRADGDRWWTVHEPRVSLPADVRTFELATWSGGRLSDWTPPIVNESATTLLWGKARCAMITADSGRVDGASVTVGSTSGSTYSSLETAGATARIDIDGSGIVGARLWGGQLTSPLYVGSSNDGRVVHVPLRSAEVGSDGTLHAELIGLDGTTITTVEVPVPTPDVVAVAVGGVATATLHGELVRITTTPLDHDRHVLRDGEVVALLPAGTGAIDVSGHQPGHVHSYQLRGVGAVPLTSQPAVVTR